jgi:hypothetical protein
MPLGLDIVFLAVCILPENDLEELHPTLDAVVIAEDSGMCTKVERKTCLLGGGDIIWILSRAWCG